MQQDDDVLKKRFVIKNSALKKKVKSEKLELLLHEKHSLLL